jgi:hypothetical protein
LVHSELRRGCASWQQEKDVARYFLVAVVPSRKDCDLAHHPKRPTPAPKTVPSPTVTRFVSAIVRAELASGRAGPGPDPAVAQRIMMRLHGHLGRLIGEVGFDVMLARAIVLARRAHPILEGLTAGPGGMLIGLDEARGDRAELDEAASAIVSHFIELLASLVGEALALRLVRDPWPGADEEERKQ